MNFQQGPAALWLGEVGCNWPSLLRMQTFLHVERESFPLLAGSSNGGVLLAVGVVDHAVDVDLFAHVHGQDEREPAGAEVGARLDPAKKKHTRT